MTRISAAAARRLAITKQGLTGPRAEASPDGIVDLARRLRCIQIDPINAVDRTHHLVLYSRLGTGYRHAHLDEVMWERKELFHYWAHAASLVLTEDYPIHNVWMKRWPEGRGVGTSQIRDWMTTNASLEREILRRLRREGPLRSRDFDGLGAVDWQSEGWTGGRNVGRMLDFLWIQGKILIAGRQGMARLWDLASRWLPEWTPRTRMSERRAVEQSALHSLRALGCATQKQISKHFTRGSYPGLTDALRRLFSRGEITTVDVGDDGVGWPGEWFVATEDLPLAATLEKDWEPRTVLLSPFDNLICDRQRTKQLFGFDYTIEIYVPKEKRRFGYYVMPILHGDRLIGRIDSRMDRREMVYQVNQVYAEADAPGDRVTGRAIRDSIESLGTWLGASSISFGPAERWRSALR